MSTEVPRMGLQSWPVHNGRDDAEPTMAAAIGAHPDFARSARLVGISFWHLHTHVVLPVDIDNSLRLKHAVSGKHHQ